MPYYSLSSIIEKATTMNNSEFEQLEQQTELLLQAYQRLKQENQLLRSQYQSLRSSLRHFFEQLKQVEQDL